MDWYVIQAYSGYEQKVKVALEERISLNNLSDKFGEILIPTEQIVELKGGAKKTMVFLAPPLSSTICSVGIKISPNLSERLFNEILSSKATFTFCS